MSVNGDARAAAEARVSGLAGAIAQIPEAMAECDRLGADAQAAFIAGLPSDFIRSIVASEPMLGAVFMALGVPVE